MRETLPKTARVTFPSQNNLTKGEETLLEDERRDEVGTSRMVAPLYLRGFEQAVGARGVFAGSERCACVFQDG